MKAREKLETIEKADKNKVEALETALGRIEKDYGKGAVMRLGEISGSLATECIPTGSLALDIALGIGGIPRGRVTEVFGAESAGKSTLALHIMAETQKLGGIAAYLAVEHAQHPVVIKLDTDYVIKSSTWMDTLLLEKHSRNTLRNYYVRGSWYFGESFGGFCLFNKTDFPLYNEHLIGWGHDDTDLYDRFKLNGVEEVTMNSLADYIFHIPHPVSDRTANYPESDKRKTELANRRIAKSKNAADRVPYDYLHKTYPYMVVEYSAKHGQAS